MLPLGTLSVLLIFKLKHLHLQVGSILWHSITHFPNWRFDIPTKLLQVFLHMSLNNGLPQVCLDGTCLSSV